MSRIPLRVMGFIQLAFVKPCPWVTGGTLAMNPLPRVLRKTIVLRSFAAIGTVIIVAIPVSAQQTANWVGSIRCDIQAQAPGYSHQESQTWTLTGGAPTVHGSVTVYPATWSVTGHGALDRTQSANRQIAQWTANVPGPNSPVKGPIGFTTYPVTREFDVTKWHAQLTVSGGYTGTDQYINNGVAQPAIPLARTLYEWQFPKIDAASTDMQVTGTRTSDVRAFVGPLQPVDAQATITCTWSLGRGSALPLPPPVSGGAVSGGSAPGGNSGPSIISFSPSSLEQGAYYVTLSLTGAATNWQWRTSRVDLGPNIFVDHGMIGSPSTTQLGAPFSVAWDAAPGPRTVTVTTGSEVVTLPNALTIVPRARPTVAQISPNSARAGDKNVTVTFTGNGTRWSSGPSPGGTTAIYLSSGNVRIYPTRTVNSPTQMTVVFDLDPAAPPGPWDIRIDNGGPVGFRDLIQIPGGFTVLP